MSGENELSLTLSVRDLVEFSARTGDLFFESSGGPTYLEGIAGHRQLQQSRGEQWQAEYALKQTVVIEGCRVILQGRVDLINARESPVIIEEIKTTYVAPERIAREKMELYRAQAKVYAYLYHLQNPPAQAPGHYEIHISLFNIPAREVHTQKQTISVDELEKFTHSLLTIYLQWYTQVREQRALVKSSAHNLQFPHAHYRPGQHRFAQGVYRTIRDQQQLLVEAPTGTGKTVSTIFPAVKAIGEGIATQILYLTAKTPAQANAQNTLALLREKGLPVDFLVLSARDRTCPCRQGSEELLTSDGRCCRTIGFYDRLPQARASSLRAQSLSPEVLGQVAVEFQLCPFALGLHLLPWMSAVICDFNYFFDPLVKLNSFESGAAERILLIDEIHNLPDRARDMFSATLSTGQLADISQNLGRVHRNIKSPAKRLSRKLLALAGTKDNLKELPQDLLASVAELVQALIAIDDSDSTDSGGIDSDSVDFFDKAIDQHKENIRELFRFYVISQIYGGAHRSLIYAEGDEKPKRVSLTLRCLDAASYLADNYKNARAIIGFSATLKPTAFYQQLLGFNKKAQSATLPAAFPPENLLVIRCDYIDTRWQQREISRAELIELIAVAFKKKTGKYLVFFPSYEYLNQVYDGFLEAFSDIRTVRQESGSTDKERTAFLDNFFNSDEPALGFAILGGIFAEGVDYLADALHGAIVIGTGMPQPTHEQKLMQAYFDSLGLNGFQYAYQFPGFTRVQQTAGRVIRSETDKGIVILIDPRFKRPDYRRLMPDEWNIIGCKSGEEIEYELERFWSQN